ncbi:hypothetical protein [Sporolactobacillus putidus]|uniref:Uncharacterized protein n=1 Tax=Sporolactobacillus putidus TaxID=492735 RepID=A0A917W245_9BACL|nr:hypothetical protein [Sporolactobacillus putidus]GGL60308.1 hypothetical protein GCM10007968_25400 [Sporolactobacillus putidus]
MSSEKERVQKRDFEIEETIGILETEMEGLIDEINELRKQRDTLIKVNAFLRDELKEVLDQLSF